jgi:hypothetical protein
MNAGPISTIQFSNPIPKRKYFDTKPPLNISHTGISFKRHIRTSPRSTSLQFGERKIRQCSTER